MKILYKINKVTLILTLVLYLTLYLGLYAQIALGCIQIISALILFLFWNKIPNKSKKHLKIYWTTVITYGMMWLIDWDTSDKLFFMIFSVIILPMSIAGYFFYILNSLKKL